MSPPCLEKENPSRRGGHGALTFFYPFYLDLKKKMISYAIVFFITLRKGCNKR